MSEYTKTTVAARLAGGWDDSLQQHISELNQRLLELLADAARAPAVVPCIPMVVELRAEWRRLPQSGLQRLATCPYLLLDAAFSAPAQWRAPLTGAVHDADAAPDTSVPVSTELLRRTLVFAWHLARANPLAACLRLGMNHECIDLIACRSLHQLEAIAETRPAWVRPRWEQRLDIWRQLLVAAGDEYSPRLRQLQLRGLQLLAGCTVVRSGNRPQR